MRYFRISFKGRKNGAIGIIYPIKVFILADDEKSALIKLSETHEWFRIYSIVDLTENKIYKNQVYNFETGKYDLCEVKV